MARGFHLAAVARFAAALSQNFAIDLGHRVGVVNIRPQHGLAARAALRGANVDFCALLHRHRGGLVHGTAALPVSAHQHRAAAGGTRRIEQAARAQGEVIPRDLDCAPLAFAASAAQRGVAGERHQRAVFGRGGGVVERVGGVEQAAAVALAQGRVGAQRDLAALACARGVYARITHADCVARSQCDVTTAASGTRRVERAAHLQAACRLHRYAPAIAGARGIEQRGAVQAQGVGTGEVYHSTTCRQPPGQQVACHGEALRRAHQQAAARAATHVHAAGEVHHRRGDFHAARGLRGAACGGDDAGVLHALRGIEQNAPAFADQAAGVQRAAVFDNAALQLVGRLGREDDEPARGQHHGFVFHQRRYLAGRDGNARQGVAAFDVQGNGLTSGQCHGARLGHDKPLVAHLRSQQRNVAAQRGFEFALVQDAGGAARALKLGLTRHKVAQANFVRGGHQPAHIDTGTGGKVHAVGVA